jgi:hypothetical protein
VQKWHFVLSSSFATSNGTPSRLRALFEMAASSHVPVITGNGSGGRICP